MKPALPLLEASAAPCCPGRPKRRARPTASYVRLFRALGDEARLEIVGLLAAAKGALCACDIESHFTLSQPTISHHLRVLRDAGLVTSDRRGTWVYYSLGRDTLRQLREFQELLQR
ncbi:MAG: ArsR family transcriptional regulator [Planctomycetota bacterium]|nr:MAG: ArsR family transcriptional regulator [Planctomycetota bacterium]